MTDDQIKHMVERFLHWKIPQGFNPDGGINFNETYRSEHGPVGTNLLSYTQAEAMVRNMLDELPQWLDMSTAPIDGTEFLCKLSNGWKVIMSAGAMIREGQRYSWWQTQGRHSIPYEPSHPANTDWKHTMRAIGWMHLPC